MSEFNLDLFDFFTFAFLSYFLKFLLFSLLYIRCHCLSIISNKNQTLIPTIATSLPYSGTKTRHIVIYVTKIKHWIEISRFSKLKFRESKIRGWQKILIFAEIKFRDLTKNCETAKFSSRENFWQSKRYLMKKSSLALVNLLI